MAIVLWVVTSLLLFASLGGCLSGRWRAFELDRGIAIDLPPDSAVTVTREFESSWLAIRLKGSTRKLLDIYVGQNWEMRNMTNQARVGAFYGLSSTESGPPYQQSLVVRLPKPWDEEIAFNYWGLNSWQQEVARRIIESLRSYR